MKVFASRFLETMSQNKTIQTEEWTWRPQNEAVLETYATGRSTASRQSTYAAEKDNRADSDRPNEGSLVA